MESCEANYTCRKNLYPMTEFGNPKRFSCPKNVSVVQIFPIS